jgi:ABC-type branched-subunit amino acid transport system ATPase component
VGANGAGTLSGGEQQMLAMCDQAYVLENERSVLEGTGKKLMANDHVRKVYLGI